MNDSVPSAVPHQTRKPSASYAFLIVCGSFMITGVLVLAWLGSKPPAKIQGKLLPAMTLDPVANSQRAFSTNDLIGKKTALLLWSPTSKACQQNLEQLSQFLSAHPDWKLSTVAFAEQGGLVIESLSGEVEQFLQKNQLQWPVYVDQSGKATMELTLLMPFGSFGFPTLLLIDDEGRLVQIVESQNEEGWKNLDKALR